ncbi:MAG: c-type cytochrome [Pseudomonadota bacterium]
MVSRLTGAGAALWLFASLAAAQVPAVKPAAGDDLRAVLANSADIAEGRRVAESSCARCHGAGGISTSKGVPHIAAQRAGYLYRQLRAYQQRGRTQNPMEAVVRFLSDEALVKVAAYYASLEPARPQPAGKTAPEVDPVQAGKAAAAACAGCHGENGVSTTPGMPSLVALDSKYFVAAMNAYRGGQRKHDVMKSFAAGLGEAALGNVALYYALQKPARAQTPAAGDAAAGKKAAVSCGGCHGDLGTSASPGTPNLAGQDAQYLAEATRAYKDGARRDETMKGLAGALEEAAIRDISAFYAAQQPQPLNVRRPLALAELVERCDRCHGAGGNSIEPLIPALAAQRADWLEPVLEAYRSGARKSSAMAAMSAQLTEADVRALAAHYSRQPARPVVYIRLPGR